MKKNRILNHSITHPARILNLKLALRNTCQQKQYHLSIIKRAHNFRWQQVFGVLQYIPLHYILTQFKTNLVQTCFNSQRHIRDVRNRVWCWDSAANGSQKPLRIQNAVCIVEYWSKTSSKIMQCAIKFHGTRGVMGPNYY